MSEEQWATALVLLSALLHATWNAWLKTLPDKLAINSFFALFGGTLFLPVLFFVPLPDARLWVAIIASTAVHILYQYCLVRLLDRTDLTIGYPIARGTGPMVVAIVSLALWPGGLSLSEFLAVGVLVSGIMLTGISAAHHRQMSVFQVPGLALALFCGLCIGAYTVIDAIGAQQADSFLGFVAWLNVLFAPSLLGVAYLQRGPEIFRAVLGVWRVGLPITLIALTGYTSALYALRIGEVGEIAALRETSIIFAGLIGYWVLKEPMGKVRALSILLIATGAVALKAF